MGRLLRPRPDPHGLAYFHAFNCGNNRSTILRDNADRLAFLEALAKAKERYPFQLYGYCLMADHFHLAIRPGAGQSISRIMQSVTVAHTWRYHKRHRSSGHVWQGRFKSPAVQDGDHLLTLLRYIEANPLRAGMVSDPAQYRWSSHAARVGDREDPLLDPFPEWGELGKTEAARRAAWRRRVARPLKEADIKEVRSSLSSGRPLGAEDWARKTMRHLGTATGPPKRRGRPPKNRKK